MGERNVPRIRFKGYTDAWERRRLGDYLYDPHPERVAVTDENQLMTVGLNLSGIRHGGNKNSLSFGSTIYYRRHAGQLIYGKQNFFHGSIAIITDEFDGMCTSGDVPSFDVNGIDTEYLYHYISRPWYYEPTESESTGTGSKRIHQNTLKDFPISVPQVRGEQRKIALLFGTLNNLLTLHQRELDKLKHIKSALLEKMFPAEGDDKPKIRFKGYTDAWERRRLGEISLIKKGQQLGKKEMLSQGEYYVLNGGQEPSGYTDKFNTPANTISISEGGNSCGFVALNKEEYWSGGHNYTLTSLDIEAEFAYAYLKKSEESLMAMRVGSGLPNIQISSLIDFYISFPSAKERQVIGKLFSKLDSLLTLHQRELDKLKNIKSALLEKMFV